MTGEKLNKLNKRQIGAMYEELACQKLRACSYTIVTTNYRCRMGEIDIIAKKDEYLIFIEVKYRKDNKTGAPEEAVNQKKQETIIKTALWYLMQHELPLDRPYRFDVVSIQGAKVHIFENAFETTGFHS